MEPVCLDPATGNQVQCIYTTSPCIKCVKDISTMCTFFYFSAIYLGLSYWLNDSNKEHIYYVSSIYRTAYVVSRVSRYTCIYGVVSKENLLEGLFFKSIGRLF